MFATLALIQMDKQSTGGLLGALLSSIGNVDGQGVDAATSQFQGLLEQAKGDAKAQAVNTQIEKLKDIIINFLTHGQIKDASAVLQQIPPQQRADFISGVKTSMLQNYPSAVQKINEIVAALKDCNPEQDIKIADVKNADLSSPAVVVKGAESVVDQAAEQSSNHSSDNNLPSTDAVELAAAAQPVHVQSQLQANTPKASPLWMIQEISADLSVQSQNGLEKAGVAVDSNNHGDEANINSWSQNIVAVIDKQIQSGDSAKSTAASAQVAAMNDAGSGDDKAPGDDIMAEVLKDQPITTQLADAAAVPAQTQQAVHSQSDSQRTAHSPVYNPNFDKGVFDIKLPWSNQAIDNSNVLQAASGSAQNAGLVDQTAVEKSDIVADSKNFVSLLEAGKSKSDINIIPQLAVQHQPTHQAEANSVSDVKQPFSLVPSSPSDQVQVHMKMALHSGTDHINIQLHPAELGHVDIKMDVAQDGTMKLHVIADRQDTLDMLRGDSSNLAKSLQQSGFKLDSSNMQFSLRDYGQNQQQAFNPYSGQQGQGNNGQGQQWQNTNQQYGSGDSSEQSMPAYIAASYNLALDIRV